MLAPAIRRPGSVRAVSFFHLASAIHYFGIHHLDTHKFVRKLQEGGFDEKQTESLTEALRAAIDESELITKKDLQIELAPLKADLLLLKWMIGFNLAFTMTVLCKVFS